MNRPDEERIPGSQPSVPSVFRWAMIDSEPISVNDDGTVNDKSPVCAFCGNKLTIADYGDVCRQCRLQGR